MNSIPVACRRLVARVPHSWVGAALAIFALLAFALAAASPAARAAEAKSCAGDAVLLAAVPAALSRPAEAGTSGAVGWQAAAYRGLSCSRCNSATQYCVLNPMRYEYACAPYGTVACISASRTHWCPASRGCWAGRCR